MIDLNELKYRIGMHEKIIAREKYFNSSVIALLAEISGECSLIFQKRAKNIRQGGEVSFPGGKVDDEDLNPLETALRESYEEIGLKEDQIEILGKIGTHVMPSGILIDAYLGRANISSLEELKLNHEEVESCFAVPIEFFKNNPPRVEKLQTETMPYYEENGVKYIFPFEELDLPKRYREPIKSKPRNVYFYKYNDKLIWGITADIVFELMKYIDNHMEGKNATF